MPLTALDFIKAIPRAVKAAWRAFTHPAGCMVFFPEGHPTPESRMRECYGCRKIEYKGEGRHLFCGECACYLKLKTRLASERCPLLKW